MALVLSCGAQPSLVTRSVVAGVCRLVRVRLLSSSSPAAPSTTAQPPYRLIFVRHGQSGWNKANRFMGWNDIDLTEEGVEEAKEAGRILKSNRIVFDEVHTSFLKRSIRSAWVMLEELQMEYLPVYCHWRLNERAYGSLVGMEKKACVAKFGKEQVHLWRRSYDIKPPPVDLSSEYYPGNDKVKYGHLKPDEIPRCESLHDTKLRALVYWNGVIAPAIRAGRRVAIVSHDNTIRALLMHLDNIPKEDVIHLEIPRSVPLMYHLDENLKPIKDPHPAELISGSYLGMGTDKLEQIKARDESMIYGQEKVSLLQERDLIKKLKEQNPNRFSDS